MSEEKKFSNHVFLVCVLCALVLAFLGLDYSELKNKKQKAQTLYEKQKTEFAQRAEKKEIEKIRAEIRALKKEGYLGKNKKGKKRHKRRRKEKQFFANTKAKDAYLVALTELTDRIMGIEKMVYNRNILLVHGTIATLSKSKAKGHLEIYSQACQKKLSSCKVRAGLGKKKEEDTFVFTLRIAIPAPVVKNAPKKRSKKRRKKQNS